MTMGELQIGIARGDHFALLGEALRDAFDATMKDPAFLADMARQKLEVRPVTGAELDKLVRELYSYPADVVKIAADAIKPPPR